MNSASGIHDPTSVDLVAYDRGADAYVLVMTQTRRWGSDEEAVRAIQAKVNGYIAYVTSGQFHRDHPDAARSSIRFQLDHVGPLPDLARQFVAAVREQLLARESIEFDVSDASEDA